MHVDDALLHRVLVSTSFEQLPHVVNPVDVCLDMGERRLDVRNHLSNLKGNYMRHRFVVGVTTAVKQTHSRELPQPIAGFGVIQLSSAHQNLLVHRIVDFGGSPDNQ